MSRRSIVVALIMTVSATACGVGEPQLSPGAEPSDGSTAPTAIPSETTVPREPGSTTSVVPASDTSLPMCDEVGHPTAPSDWYGASPIYVGNEMPIEAIRSFASDLEGYENIWIDREHNGWVTVGFVDADVASHQRRLEEEFPDAGVVAVEMPYTYAELDGIRERIHERLPEDMDASNMFETRGVVTIWVGRLTPERIAIVEDVVGDDPACMEGQDPATTPEPGPQPAGGDGWIYLAEVDSMLEGGQQTIVAADRPTLEELWVALGGEGPAPTVDFESHIVVGFPLLFSGSCPETRFDDVIVDDGLIHPSISHIHETQFCTADGNPRIYLIAIERMALPAPPFRISDEEESTNQIEVSVDLRPPGSRPAEGDIEAITVERPRMATPTPLVIETGFPWPMTIDVSCGIDYLGVINGVGWHVADEATLPAAWETATVDGLLDVELLMEPGPEPSMTATAGGRAILYLPGPDRGDPC